MLIELVLKFARSITYVCFKIESLKYLKDFCEKYIRIERFINKNLNHILDNDIIWTFLFSKSPFEQNKTRQCIFSLYQWFNNVRFI